MQDSRVSVARALVLSSLVWVAGCGVNEPENEQHPSSRGQAIEEHPICVEHASPGRVTIRWVDLGEESPTRNDKVAVVVSNPRNTPVSFSAFASTTGVGPHFKRLSLGSFTLAGGEERTLSIAVSDLPMHSTDLSCALRVEAEFEDSQGDSRKVRSQPVFFHMTEGNKDAFFYGSETMARKFHGGVVNGNALTAAGRIKRADGTWEESAPMAAAEATAGFKQGPTSLVLEEPSTQDAFSDPVMATTSSSELTASFDFQLAAYYRVCTVWSAMFADANHGEDYGTGADTQPVPASYNQSYVQTYGTNVVVWSGTLDAEGCTPPLRLGGTYQISQKPSVSNGTSRIDVVTDVLGGVPGTYRYLLTTFSATGVVWPLGSVGRINVVPSNPQPPLVNSAAVASRIMVTPDIGLPTGKINLWMADGCELGKPWSTCTKGADSHIGTLAPNGLTDSDYKFVMTHEVGHAIQYLSMGTPQNFYDEPAEAMPSSPYCRCDHVDTYMGTSHCLQSRERISAAQVEGFAHLVAAKVWNNQAESSCSWAYYKYFLEPPNAQVSDVPMQKTCSGNPKWMENMCPAGEADHGVEWDWQSYFWNLNTQGNAKVTMPELYAVYQASPACSGNCMNDNVLWEDFRTGAQSFFGYGSAKFNHAFNSAELAGVDH